MARASSLGGIRLSAVRAAYDPETVSEEGKAKSRFSSTMRRRRPSGGSASTAATIVSAAPFTSSSVVPISVVRSSGMPSDAKTA